MSPAAFIAAAGRPSARLIASITYAPGVCRLTSGAVYGEDRGRMAARRVAAAVCRGLDIRPGHLDAEPATDNPAEPACYVLDARPGRDMARVARVIGLTDDGFMDGAIAAGLGDSNRRRAIHRSLGEG